MRMVIATIILAFTALETQATPTKSGDYYYEVNADPNTVTIVQYEGAYGAVEIPSTLDGKTVTALGNDLFNHRPLLTSLSLPTTLTSIGDRVFVSCVSLPSVVIPPLVTSIGIEAFENCSGMGVLTFAGNNVTSLGEAAFERCSQLTSVDLPNGVTAIPNRLFGNCSNLSSVRLGRDVTSIGDYAFGSCSLTAIDLPEALLSIGEQAFAYDRFTYVRIPDRVTAIGAMAFYHCWQLTLATIGKSVTTIGDHAFDYCGWLTEIYFEGDAPALGNSVFYYSGLKAYYKAGTSDWEQTFGDRATVLWNPLLLAEPTVFGMQTNGFCFTIAESSSGLFAVTCSTNLSPGSWQSLLIRRMEGGLVRFSDPDARLYPTRYYRLGMP